MSTGKTAERDAKKTAARREQLRGLDGTVCWYTDDRLDAPECGERAVFRVLRRGTDTAHPDPARDNRDCCPEHLPVTVELTDESAASGFIVHVTVIASLLDRLAGEGS